MKNSTQVFKFTIPLSYKIAVFGLLALAAVIYPKPVRANLSETYAQSCYRFGSKGTVDKKWHCIDWFFPKFVVSQRFVKNECVTVLLIARDGAKYTVADVVNVILPQNKGVNQEWQRTPDDYSIAAWITTDGLIYTQLFEDGNVRLAYRWWLEKHHLLDNSQPANHAPIEDDVLPGEGTTM
jgi:hypothetical protein